MSDRAAIVRHLRAVISLTYDSDIRKKAAELIEEAEKGREFSSINSVNHVLSDVLIAIIERERTSQDERWGKQVLSPTEWLTVIAEEFGEVAKQVKERKDVRTELIQLTAVCVAWLEEITVKS